VALRIFGEHNLQNLSAAMYACEKAGISKDKFYSAIKSFSGAARRLQQISQKENTSVFYDFAHSPSKLKATTDAVKKQFPERRLYACMELHTFSSLNKNFLEQYNDAMSKADEAFVYYNPKTIEHKKLESINKDEVQYAFGGNVRVFTDNTELVDELKKLDKSNAVFLLMSSGNFGGLNIKELSDILIG
jgi:UDP-N-acetylmuramate: L-alanyl-gamma-D-glutamyl-meso-diaminopimelate ligase